MITMLGLSNRTPEPLTEAECAENGYIVRDCPDCWLNGPDDHGDYDIRDHGVAYYYCPNCHHEWWPDGKSPYLWSPVDVVINLAFVAFLAVGLVATMVTTAWVARYTWHWSRDDAVMAPLWLGAPAWLACVVIGTTLARWVINAGRAVIDYLWGPPLCWFDIVPRRPRA